MEIFIGVSAMLGEPRDLLRQRGRIIDLVCPAGAAGGDGDLLGTWGSLGPLGGVLLGSESCWLFRVSLGSLGTFRRLGTAPRTWGHVPWSWMRGFLHPGTISWTYKSLRLGTVSQSLGWCLGMVTWSWGHLGSRDNISDLRMVFWERLGLEDGGPGWGQQLGLGDMVWLGRWRLGSRGLGAGNDIWGWGTVSWVGGQ